MTPILTLVGFIALLGSCLWIFERWFRDRVDYRASEFKRAQIEKAQELDTKEVNELKALKERMAKMELSVGLRPPQKRG